MRAWWMFVILMRCWLAHAFQPQCTYSSNATLKTVCVPASDNVLVPCPDSTGEETKYNVYRNNEIIFTYNYNVGSNGSTSGPLFVRMGMEPYQNAKDTLVGFTLSRVNISSRGIYRCEGTVTFPPPLLQLQSQQWILVLIEGHQCNLTCNSGEQDCGFHWKWILALVVLYSTIATICAICYRRKWKSSDCNNDYVNTKPKATRDRRKNGETFRPFVQRY